MKKNNENTHTWELPEREKVKVFQLKPTIKKPIAW